MATEILRPNAAGDEENIEYGTSGVGNHHLDVDEASPDEDTTILQQGGITYRQDLYNIEDHSVGSGTINHIHVYARFETTIAPNTPNFIIHIKAGTGTGAPTTVGSSAETQATASYEDYSQEFSVNPATSAAFTWDEIDKLQIGVSMHWATTTGGWTKCTQVYVVVDYTPTPGWTGKISGVTNPAKIMGVAVANIAKVKGVS